MHCGNYSEMDHKQTSPDASPDALIPWTGKGMDLEFKAGLVSVIIPAFNRADLIAETLDSIWNQTWRPIEVLIMDDGSTDDTAGAVERWRRDHSSDPSFLLHYRKLEHRGAPAARNDGLLQSQGEFIQFLDSDDVLHPDKLTLQGNVLQSDPKLDFVWSASAFFEREPDYSAPPYCGFPREPLPGDRLDGPFWHTSGGLYRRRLCAAIGPWDEALHRDQDWEYSIRLCALQPAVHHMPGTLSLTRRNHEGRINDLAHKVDGIRWGLLATDKAADVLRAKHMNSPAVESGIARRYFRFAKNALQHNRDELWDEAMNKASDCAADGRLRMKLRALQGLRRVAGKGALRRVMARKYEEL